MVGCPSDQIRKIQDSHVEWCLVELILQMRKAKTRNQGMSLIELMIAMFVLLVGIVGNITLVALATGGNGRSRQQSNSTAIAQMVTEKISSVKASTSPNLTITDCAGNSLTIATATGGGALTSSGDVDYSQAAVANYQMLPTAGLRRHASHV